MKDVVDSSGFRVIFQEDGSHLRMIGAGPRGGQLGEAILNRRSAIMLLEELEAIANGEKPKQLSFSLATDAGGALLLMRPIKDAPIESYTLYLPGPAGGYRPPVRIYEEATLGYMRDIIAAHITAER